MAFQGKMWDVLETYRYVQNGEEKRGYKNVGVAFPGKGGNDGGFNILFRGVVTIVPGVNDLVLFVHSDKNRRDAGTDFPPQPEQSMEASAPQEGQGGYPEEPQS